ncbi:MFS general substrate transporter [Tothia fuscella]|uniref:MFS general substrate transporter n=1 Tax=Tothia fuscella TaxID=1048955 RepID=A0A9P4TWJ5_9PEZI|nr:MFS general substrate transporter [Tothia fuscella]
MASTAFKPFKWLYAETGFSSVLSTGKDAWLVILSRSLRMFAFGFNALIMGLFFQELGYSDDAMGLFFTLTLLGDVLLSLFLTLVADQIGRRKILFGGSILMVLSGATFAWSDNYWILLVAAVLGVISPSGNEIGPFRAVEESILAGLTVPGTRTEVVTWYVVTATVGTSTGLVVCGNLVDWAMKDGGTESRGWTGRETYHFCFWIYSTVGVVNMVLALLLSNKCEVDGGERTRHPATEQDAFLGDESDEEAGISPAELRKSEKSPQKKSKFAQISPESRPILYKLCAIMSLDSFSSGMAAYSLINLYMDRKFSLPKGQLGDIMSITWFTAAFMNMFASALSRRIGLIKTMVFTHLPSAVFLALLPLPKTLTPTIGLLLARASLNSMDQAPRTAFIAAVVRPEERTAVMGIVNVGKILAQSGGPSLTGWLASRDLFGLAFVTAGVLKGCYDLGLLGMFVGMKLHRHERTGEREAEGYRAVDTEEQEEEEGEEEEEDPKSGDRKNHRRSDSYPLKETK